MAENKWDAQRYAQNARFVSNLGMPVVELLAPVSGESILDLGCGDGALTAKLAALGVHVFGIDSSQSMITAAAQRGLPVALADMHDFHLNRIFDAVFTNAVLHWTQDIHATVASVQRHLHAGGRFVGEFGGFGNIAAIATAIRAAVELEGAPQPTFSWYYPTPSEFKAVLDAHGFDTISIELIPRPTPLPTGMSGWLRTFAQPFGDGLPAEVQERILDRAVTLLQPALQDKEGNWVADYVRLRFHAVQRPAISGA
ncbi:class I SAM-dependent methyltransferase [Bryobacter aggregatus]|uniref:class I SAM-dependent methyltransferase n=1 Tax=Bryobacter aggregatus TaxID=360054 RepID=UPI0004E26D62|nr:class I SAM-dependent methyltransferase [Bryobacter aggregatus]